MLPKNFEELVRKVESESLTITENTERIFRDVVVYELLFDLRNRGLIIDRDLPTLALPTAELLSMDDIRRLAIGHGVSSTFNLEEEAYSFFSSIPTDRVNVESAVISNMFPQIKEVCNFIATKEHEINVSVYSAALRRNEISMVFFVDNWYKNSFSLIQEAVKKFDSDENDGVKLRHFISYYSQSLVNFLANLGYEFFPQSIHYPIGYEQKVRKSRLSRYNSNDVSYVSSTLDHFNGFLT